MISATCAEPGVRVQREENLNIPRHHDRDFVTSISHRRGMNKDRGKT